MKSIKLSSSKRKSILSSVIEAWKVDKPDNSKEIESLKHEVALDYYHQSDFGKEVCALLKQIKNKSLLESLFKKERGFLVQINGSMERFVLREGMPMPYYNPCLLVVDERSELHEKLVLLVKEHELWLKDHANLSSEVGELLETCNSTGQLLEMWPEIKPLLPAYLIDPSKGVKLPSIPVSRLNERLGLGG